MKMEFAPPGAKTVSAFMKRVAKRTRMLHPILAGPSNSSTISSRPGLLKKILGKDLKFVRLKTE
jgi:hypothetical protein